MVRILEALRAELLAMQAQDIAVRSSLPPVDAPKFTAAVQQMLESDAIHTARVKEIVAANGWPGFGLVGRDGAKVVFLLVQHADADRAFQAHCLELLREAAQHGDAEPAWMAFLTDRLRVSRGEAQVYGTQMRVLEDGKLEPFLIENVASVDARRAALGLDPIETYLQQFQNKN